MSIKKQNIKPLEIERKFLPSTNDIAWNKDIISSELLFQTYLKDEIDIPYRVRLHLNKKDHKKESVSSDIHAVSCYKKLIDNIDGVPIYTEVEAPLDFEKALTIIKKNREFLIVKKRSYIPFNEFIFEIDDYLTYPGLVLEPNMWSFEGNLQTIEVEFKKIEDVKLFNSYVMPEWLGIEVTNDDRYKNSNLAKCEKNKNFIALTDSLLDKIIILNSYKKKLKLISR